MHAETTGSEHFSLSMSAAIARADRESIDDLGTLMIRQIATLQLLGRFLAIDFRALYETDNEGWLKLTLYTEGFYQQIHAVVTTAAVFIGQRTSPALTVDRLSRLQDVVQSERHPLDAVMRKKSVEIDLLRWLQKVRNRAIQHRAEAGYAGGRAVVLPTAFALLHRTDPIEPKIQRKANDLLVGLHRRYGDANQEPVKSREVITYLDLFSHGLFKNARADFTSARRIIEEADAFDAIVSPLVLGNADIALAALIEMAPPHPTG